MLFPITSVLEITNLFSRSKFCDSCADAFQWGIPARAFSRPDIGTTMLGDRKGASSFFLISRAGITFRCECYYYYRVASYALLKSKMCSSSVLYGAARYNLCFTSTRSRGRNNSSGWLVHSHYIYPGRESKSDVGSSGSQIKKNPSPVLLLHSGPRSLAGAFIILSSESTS